VDILPLCLSSVYLFYDPDYDFLTLGVWTALKEIEWVQGYYTSHPNTELFYYYLGYYIHSCPKMRYKLRFVPSQLLCPIRYTWHDAALCIPYLDVAKFVILSDIAPIKETYQPSSTTTPSSAADTDESSAPATKQASKKQKKKDKKFSNNVNSSGSGSSSRSSNSQDTADVMKKAEDKQVSASSKPSIPSSVGSARRDPTTRAPSAPSATVSAILPNHYSPNSATITQEEKAKSRQAEEMLPLLPLFVNNRKLAFSSVASRASEHFKALLKEYIGLVGSELCRKLVIIV